MAVYTSEKIAFTKMEALGNDIILIDSTNTDLNSFHQIGRLISNRKFGVGADNVIFLLPGTRVYDYKVIIINPDGSEAPMCGNALLCLGRYIHDNGLTREKKVNILTKNGIKNISYPSHFYQDRMVKINMGKARVGTSEKKMIETIQIDNRSIDITFIDTGAPHAVVFLNDDELHGYPVHEIGPMIERHPHFTDTTNVMFGLIRNENEIDVRCWERGGTGESLACGTGACAVAYAASIRYNSSKKICIKFLFGHVIVDIDTDNTIFLTGHSNYICNGDWIMQKVD